MTTARDDIGGVTASWWNAVCSLVMLIVTAHAPVVIGLSRHVDSGETALDWGVPAAAAILVVAGVSALLQMVIVPWFREGFGVDVRSRLVVGIGLAAAVAVWIPLYEIPGASLPLVVWIALIACFPSDRGTRRRLVGVSMVVALVTAWIARAAGTMDVNLFFVIFGSFFPVIVVASVWLWDVVQRLDRARTAQADLAVTRERLRFASDLHDAQGHTLQVIALKAELAERLLEKKPEAAAAQIAEVRQEAARALAETRELVYSYRSRGLEDEFENAVDVLGDAGFDLKIGDRDFPASEQASAMFGRALREATTNVLRHAGPGTVHIGMCRVEGGAGEGSARGPGHRLVVENDIRSENPAAMPFVGRGQGLSGLEERTRAAGGELAARVRDDTTEPRFVLEVTLPDRLKEEVP